MFTRVEERGGATASNPLHAPPTTAAVPAAELRRGPAVLRESDFVFPGGKKGRPLSNMAMLAVLKRMKRDDLTAHGFRSTFRDWAAERTNFPREVVEMALAHTIENKVEAAYRRGDLFQKRTQLMEAWARFSKITLSTVTISRSTALHDAVLSTSARK